MVKEPRRPHDPWNSLDRLTGYWILDKDRTPKLVDNETWLAWSLDNDWETNHRVAETITATMRVSTVFLGVNCNFWRGGPAICFETMTFTLDQFPREFEGKIRFSPDDLDQRRYSTWDDAVTGHNAIVRRIQKGEADALAQIKIQKADRPK